MDIRKNTAEDSFDMLFYNITTVTLHEEPYVRPHQYVGVQNGKIVYVANTPPAQPATRSFDGQGNVLMPGLINTHTHLPMTLLRGYADDYDLRTWLFDYIMPAEAKLDERAAKAGALLGIAEALASGTTSVSDMYFLNIGEAAIETGINANISSDCRLQDGGFDWQTNPSARNLREMVERWHGYDDGRIFVDASIHAEYTSNEQLWTPVVDYAKKMGIGMHLHLSETQSENEACKSRNAGLTPTDVFAEAGVFDVRTTAAHGVFLSDHDMDVLAQKDVSVASNPVSNLKLASGVAPVVAMLKKGINVTLGTDGTSSNNNLDMFEEMKLCALLQKAESKDASVMAAAEVLKMATVNGAKSQGRADTGYIAVGAYADLIVVDFTKPHMMPCHDVLSQLVYAASGADVRLTAVRGKVLYEDGHFTTIDLTAVQNEIEHYAVPLIKQTDL